MSSTDPKRFAAKAKAFFERRLMPAARALRSRQGEPFPRGFDPAATTYYERRAKATMEPADFELPSIDSPQALALALERFWKERSLPELARLAPDLADLAAEVRADDEESGEVSPFIYQMF